MSATIKIVGVGYTSVECSSSNGGSASASSKVQITHPLPPQQSRSELRLRARYPGIIFDFTGLSETVMETTADAFVRVVDQYPFLANRLTYMGTVDYKGIYNGWAEYLRTGNYYLCMDSCPAQRSYMFLNPAWYADHEKFSDDISKGSKMGLWICRDTNGVGGLLVNHLGYVMYSHLYCVSNGKFLERVAYEFKAITNSRKSSAPVLCEGLASSLPSVSNALWIIPSPLIPRCWQ